MTRVDFIEKLKNLVYQSSHDDVMFSTQEATCLLLFLEQNGMAPPQLPTQMIRALHNILCYPEERMWEEDFLANSKLKNEYERLLAYEALSPEERKAQGQKAFKALRQRRQNV